MTAAIHSHVYNYALCDLYLALKLCKTLSGNSSAMSPWLPEDIILCVPKVTAVPHKYLAEGDPLLGGVKGHLLSTEAASCLSEGRVEVLG